MSRPMRIGVLVSVLLHAALVAALVALPFYPASETDGRADVAVRLVMGQSAPAVEAGRAAPKPLMDKPRQSTPATAVSDRAALPTAPLTHDNTRVDPAREIAEAQADAPGPEVSEAVAQASPIKPDVRNAWLRSLATRINEHKFYPAACRRFGEQGQVTIALVIGREGQLEDVSVLSSSGHARLDDAAMEAVRAAAPFTPIPASFPHDSWSVNVPVDFALR